MKGQVRNPKKVEEADVVALKTSYLKKLNKGYNIVILNSYCDVAKTVARMLTELGFTQCITRGGSFAVKVDPCCCSSVRHHKLSSSSDFSKASSGKRQ